MTAYGTTYGKNLHDTGSMIAMMDAVARAELVTKTVDASRLAQQMLDELYDLGFVVKRRHRLSPEALPARLQGREAPTPFLEQLWVRFIHWFRSLP